MNGVVTEQIPLKLSWREGFSFKNFFVSGFPEGNNEVVHHLQKIASSDAGEQFLFVWGFNNVGKSHLLQASCQQAADSGFSVAYLPLAEVEELDSEMFAGLESMSLVCIDDVQKIAGNEQCEEALFHLYNRMRDVGNKMIVSANVAPAALPVGLADLQSRLGWGPVLHLQELNDENKIEALQLRAKARGFELTEEVGLYLIRRSARDMSSLFALLDKLDEASLAQHRKLTIPFVRDLI